VRREVEVLVALLCFLSVAGVLPSARGVVLTLSDYSSDGTVYNTAEYLSADLDFSVVGTTLTLIVTNNTFYDYPNSNQTAFDISKLFFNINEDTVTGLTLTAVWECDETGGHLNDNQAQKWINENTGVAVDGFHVDGFGLYDAQLVGDDTSVVIEPTGPPVYSVEFVFEISGTEPYSDADFTTHLSSRYDEQPEILGLAAAKFIHGGPEGMNDSAYGMVIPEPATVLLLGCLV